MWRWMFSSTTIASSTTRPIASTMPSSVRMLIVKPKIQRKKNAPISDTGMVTNGISVARKRAQEEEDHQHHQQHRLEHRLVDRLDRFLDEDRGVERDDRASCPAGSAALMRGSCAFTARATDSVLAVDCLTMPRPTAGWPLTRTTLRSSCGAELGAADVLQPHRVAARPRATMRLLNCSGVRRSVSESTVNSRCVLSMRPDGISTFCRRSASSTSCGVRP